jgi:hypothetical protein
MESEKGMRLWVKRCQIRLLHAFTLCADEEGEAGAKGAFIRFFFEALAHELIPVTVQSIRGGEGCFDDAEIGEPGHEPACVELVIGERGGGVLGEILDLDGAIHDAGEIRIDGGHGITGDDAARGFEGLCLGVRGEHLQPGEAGGSEDAIEVSGKRGLQLEVERCVIGIGHGGDGLSASKLGFELGADFFFDANAETLGAFVRIQDVTCAALDIGIGGISTGIGKAQP